MSVKGSISCPRPSTRRPGCCCAHRSTAGFVRQRIQSTVDEVNRDLARVEQIKRFTILPRSFSVEDGELTPTLKIKRKVVAEHFAREIDAMYADDAPAKTAS